MSCALIGLAVVLVFYEYLLTFSTEYYQIWCRKWTIPSVLYLVNRYTLYLLVPTTWFADYVAPDSSVSTMLQSASTSALCLIVLWSQQT